MANRWRRIVRILGVVELVLGIVLLPRYYTVEGMQIEQTVHLFLTPGTYSIYTRYLPGAVPGLTGKFEYKLS